MNLNQARCKPVACLVATSITFACSASAMGAPPAESAAIQIDARKVVHAVPRTVFGGFLEPIRSAIYTGGIWAQLIENPSFEGDLWGVSTVTHMLQAMPQLADASKVGLPLPWESLRP